MKKVVIYSRELLPYSETFIREQASALRDWHPVLVGEKQVVRGLSLDGIDVHLLQGGGSVTRRWLHQAHRFAGLPYARSVQALRDIGPILAHAHFATNAVDFWPLARAAGLPLLVTLHGYDINIHPEWWEAGHGGWRRRAYPRQLRRLGQEPHVHFIAVSEAIRRRAIAYGIPPERITLRYIGVDTVRFQPDGAPLAQRANRILYVGRLVEKKGAADLIRAYAAVREHVADAQLVVVGDGPLSEDLRRLARQLDAPVEFLGALSSDEVRRQMHLAKVFCLPSIVARNGDAEGLPISILEAQACGLPVLTSARGGVGEGVLDGITGYCFDEHDTATLTEHVLTLLRDDELLTKMGRAGTEHVGKHFDLMRCTALLEQTYAAVASGQHGPS